MTLFHLADATTTNSPASTPVKVVDLAKVQGTGPLNWLVVETVTFRMAGATTCTGTFQWVGSNDSELILPPNGTGGVWDNIGSATTITSTGGVTAGSATLTSTIPYHRQGVIISAIAGGGAASALLNA